MLGEASPRLYFDVTGQIYRPEEEKPEVRKAVAEEKKPAAEVENKAEEKQPEGKDPFLTLLAAGMGRLRTKRRYVYIGAAVILLVLVFGFAGLHHRAGPAKPRPEVMSAAKLDYHLNQEYEIAQHLSAVDFARYARNYPQAAKDSVENLAAFVEKNRHTPDLAPAQAQKMLFISNIVPRLQADLTKAASN